MKSVVFLISCFSCFFIQAQEGSDEIVDPNPYFIESIYFGGGSYYVDEYQLAALYHLIDSVPNIKDYTITIHSHTDNIGGAAYNEWLSKMRSESVIEKLLAVEFSMSQIEIKDFGQFNPVYDNSTWQGRMKNRRVDIIFRPVVF